ncbi:DUF3842 family protein [Alkaliphilus crotonatoxidans]
MKIAVIDGQGGGLGRTIIEKMKNQLKSDNLEIIALGTNSLATSNMMKAGAHSGATGENAIKVMANRVDVIVGPLAILVANAMMGEITSEMAAAVASSPAQKMILPMNRCGIFVAGIKELNMTEMIDSLILQLSRMTF